MLVVSRSQRSACRRSLVVDWAYLMWLHSLTHRSPVAVRPGPAAAAHVGGTVRLRRRFTSDAAGYWVQLFTLGSVTGPGRSGPSRAPPPSGIQLTGPSVGLSGGRRLLTLSLIFRADGVRAGTLSVVRTSSAPAVDVSNDSSIQCWKCARDWRRASVIDTDEDVFNSPLYWRQQSSVDIDYSVTRMR